MDRWKDLMAVESQGRRVTDGNRVKHLKDDDRALHAFWRQIEQAQRRVWMSMYTIEPDAVGLGTLERLAAAAQRGCEVRLVYDFFGSIHLRPKHVEALRQHGGRATAFHRVWPPSRKHGAFGLRNHRKLLLIDDAVAFCGGMNLSEDYAGHEFEPWTFDDTVLRLEGPCVAELADIFLRTWKEELGEDGEAPPPMPPAPDGIRVDVLETDSRRPQTQLQETLERAIGNARQRCRIATPYFIPADWLAGALIDAAARGVDVQVMTAGRTDMPIARAAGRLCYGRLLRGGIRIFEHFGRVMHSKMASIDGCFGIVGSYNMDLWTSRHVLDVSVSFADAPLARSLEEEFESFKRNASEFTLAQYEKRGMPTRLVQWAALQLARTI